ncbi:MAG: UDP-glucose dehydrogenase family protein, partial [Dehalococcoidia bacterium]
PVGSTRFVQRVLHEAAGGQLDRVTVASNPEFLREGQAVRDFLNPDRIVVGCDDPEAAVKVSDLYRSMRAPVIVTDPASAEMIKYASNAFLATKISFINEISAVCEALGADVDAVSRGMGLDRRIGSQFLKAGLGWGGSCFPKDVKALAHMAAVHGAHPQLLRSVMDINSDQRLRVVQKVRQLVGGLDGVRVAVLGAAFKPDTDDIRNSPAIDLVALLTLEGANVRVYDPVVPAERLAMALPRTTVAESLLSAVAGAEIVVIATEWEEFRRMDLRAAGAAVARRNLVDTRNCIDPRAASDAGWTYRCVGRPGAEQDQQPSHGAVLVAGGGQ